MFMNDESSKCPVPKSFVDHFLTSLLISECILWTAINRQPSCGPKGPRRVTRVTNIFSTSFTFFAARRISSLFTSIEVPTSSVDATLLRIHEHLFYKRHQFFIARPWIVNSHYASGETGKEFLWISMGEAFFQNLEKLYLFDFIMGTIAKGS